VLARRLLGRTFGAPPAAGHTLTQETRILGLQTREFGPLAQAIAGVDVALWDLVARRAGLPLWRLLGGEQATGRVPVYASGINPDAAAEMLPAARQAGYRAFKVKIGFSPDADRTTVLGLGDSMAAGETFMVDANQAWNLAEAQAIAPVVAEAGARWLEEPLSVDAPTEHWETLARTAGLALAGGENLASVLEFTHAADRGWLQVIQPDLCKWGGLSMAVPVARYAIAAGRRYCPHYLGGGIGLLASGHALAAAGGDGLLEVDFNPNPLRVMLATPFPGIAKGCMTLPDGPGLGVAPDLDAVAEWRTLTRRETARQAID